MRVCQSLKNIRSPSQSPSKYNRAASQSKFILTKLKQIQAREEKCKEIREMFSYKMPQSVLDELRRNVTKSKEKKKTSFLRLIVNSVRNQASIPAYDTIDSEATLNEPRQSKLAINLNKFKRVIKEETTIRDRFNSENSIKDTIGSNEESIKNYNYQGIFKTIAAVSSPSLNRDIILPEINCQPSQYVNIIKRVSQSLSSANRLYSSEHYKTQLLTVFKNYSKDEVSKHLLERLDLLTRKERNEALLFRNHFVFSQSKNRKHVRSCWESLLTKLSVFVPEYIVKELALLK